MVRRRLHRPTASGTSTKAVIDGCPNLSDRHPRAGKAVPGSTSLLPSVGPVGISRREDRLRSWPVLWAVGCLWAVSALSITHSDKQATISGYRFIPSRGTLRLVCHPPSDANKTLSITWMHNGLIQSSPIQSASSLSHRHFKITGQAGEEFVVQNVESSDSGIFQCLISYLDENGNIDFASALHNVTVFEQPADQHSYSPVIVNIASTKVIYKGFNASLFCDARWHGFVWWFRVSSSKVSLLQPNGRIHLHGRWLNITAARQTDSGNYMCQAVSAVGNKYVNRTAFVHVWPAEKPQFPPVAYFHQRDLLLDVNRSANEAAYISHFVVAVHSQERDWKRVFPFDRNGSVQLSSVVGDLSTVLWKTIDIRVMFANRFGNSTHISFPPIFLSVPVAPLLYAKHTDGADSIFVRIVQLTTPNSNSLRVRYSAEYRNVNVSFKWVDLGVQTQPAFTIRGVGRQSFYQIRLIAHFAGGYKQYVYARDVFTRNTKAKQDMAAAITHQPPTSTRSSTLLNVTTSVQIIVRMKGLFFCEALADLKWVKGVVQHSIEMYFSSLCKCTVTMRAKHLDILLTPIREHENDTTCFPNGIKQVAYFCDYQMSAESSEPCTNLQQIKEGLHGSSGGYLSSEVGLLHLVTVCVEDKPGMSNDHVCNQFQRYQLTSPRTNLTCMAFHQATNQPVGISKRSVSPMYTRQTTDYSSNDILPATLAKKQHSSNHFNLMLFVVIVTTVLCFILLLLVSTFIYKQWLIKSSS